MTKKEERADRKETKVAEFVGVFSREYEMWRAHGVRVQTASFKAMDALLFEIRKACREFPQEKSFIIDCKIEVVSKVEGIIISIEKEAASRSYSKPGSVTVLKEVSCAA